MPESLAIDGGTPVRTATWPAMFPGGTEYGEEEKRAAIEVIEAQSPFRYYGTNLLKKVDQLEAAYARYVGTRFALATHSGSTALSVAIAALGVGPGTEVILPAFMWIADVNAVIHLRGIPVLAEIDETLNLDPADIEKRITKRTKAIVAVHMAGSVADMPAIKAVADKHGIPVLEDCSQAAGASIDGHVVGSMGAIGTVSLQYNKNFTTGEGGMITTSDDVLFRRAICFHDGGFERDMQGVSIPRDSPFETWGMGARMDELRGAVGLVQLGKLPDIVRRMRGHQLRLREALGKLPGIHLRRLVDPNEDSGAYFTWLHDTTDAAERFTTALKAEGIPVSPPHGGIHQYRHMSNLLKNVPVTTEGCPWTCPFNKESPMEYNASMLPRSNSLLDRARLISLPPSLTEQDEDDIIRAFRKVARVVLG
ncbi:MAG: DegT/DnrJ/EryC1/StrS family aminotransferase [Candidatus Latescibacteria bacterium]|nr:DegT/DnrJ/EryC1/StrS family aminotransferase [Candidatus Latescibacterota bacterium]